MPKKQKYYVVFRGASTGVYDTWDECKTRVSGYKNASFASFGTKQEAAAALEVGDLKEWRAMEAAKRDDSRPKGVYLAVDAACSGPPGPVEYQGVLMPEGSVVFKRGPFPDGTNNIGEFLAIVDGMRWVNKHCMTIPIYSDSLCALSWVKGGGKCRSTMENIGSELSRWIDATERWMCGPDASRCVKLLRKWDTGEWGEIPADFGRK